MSETNFEAEPSKRVRTERYARGAAMLRNWIVESDLDDECGYDWEAIEAELNYGEMACTAR